MSFKLFLRTKLFFWKEQLHVIRYFYPKFALVDLFFGLFYLFSNPFRICRGEYTYGETPLTAWKKIADLARIGSKDVFLDLGCGRGRLCFWTRCMIGCRSIGIDGVSPFINKANRVKRFLYLDSVDFFCSRITLAPISKATVIYLYTFHPDEEQLDFSQLREDARVISVSEPIVGLRVLSECQVYFPWGKADIYINIKK